MRELLDSKIKKSILFLGKIHKNNINLFVNNNVRCTINDIKDIDILDEILGEKQHVICHLKIDTGLNRMGCEFNSYKEVINVFRKFWMKKILIPDRSTEAIIEKEVFGDNYDQNWAFNH